MNAYVYIYTNFSNAYYMYIYVYLFVYVYTYIYIYVQTYMHTYLSTGFPTCLHVIRTYKHIFLYFWILCILYVCTARAACACGRKACNACKRRLYFSSMALWNLYFSQTTTICSARQNEKDRNAETKDEHIYRGSPKTKKLNDLITVKNQNENTSRGSPLKNRHVGT